MFKNLMTMLRGRVFGVAKEKKKRSCVNSTRRCAQASSISFSFAKSNVESIEKILQFFPPPQLELAYLTHTKTHLN